MKKTKRSPEVKTVAAQKPRSWWWPWAASLAALFVVFEAYGPALHGAYVLDDRFLPFDAPQISENVISGWVGSLRPLLMFSFWLNHHWFGPDPYSFHVTNVLIHFLTAVLATIITAKLVEWAGVEGPMRTALSVFAGAVFLLHPVQTESVAYVASRSENLAVLLYFAAFALFIYKTTDSITPLRALAILALFAAALGVKEHTLTLPALLIATDYFWKRGGLRKNVWLYGLLAGTGAVGAFFIAKILRTTNTAGFRVEDITPAGYFFTQCRVIWTYVRLFFIPFGLNIDADVPVSRTLFQNGAIFGLIALIAGVVAAWVYRKRFPLASFGVLMFLLLIAPTSSFVPIKDVFAERRLYLPFLGLILVCIELMRRLKLSQVVWIAVAVVALHAGLTYQRTEVWSSPLTLWQDSVAKSPNKWRPRFQLAFAQYEENHCAQSAQSYERASQLGPVDEHLLIDWALALDCAGLADEAVAKLQRALKFGATAHIYSQIGMVYGKRGRTQEALAALAAAEMVDPRYEMTFVYRGNVYEKAGDVVSAVKEYQHALQLNPANQAARENLIRVSR